MQISMCFLEFFTPKKFRTWGLVKDTISISG